MQLKSLLVGLVPCFLASPFSVRSIMLRIGLIASLFVLFGQSQTRIILKMWEINAVMKTKDSICVGILSDQVEAATVSILNKYTIVSQLSKCLKLMTFREGYFV